MKGQYTGIMPDDKTLCTSLASDCHKSENMYYSVAPCTNLSVHYEGKFLTPKRRAQFFFILVYFRGPYIC